MLAGIRRRPAYALYHLFWCAMDWLYPPICGGCDQLGERWCTDCQVKAARIIGPTCPRCGLPQRTSRICAACRMHPPAFDSLRSWGIYKGPLRQAIHKLKYRRDLGLTEPLATHLKDLFYAQNWQVDFVTCVPLSHIRQKERGYNQSKEIARPLAFTLSLPFQPRAIQRLRNTPSQVGLSAEERSTNVRGAFCAQSSMVTGKSILLVDDVATTGATLNACAGAIREAGAAHVFAVTLARAVRLSDHAVETA